MEKQNKKLYLVAIRKPDYFYVVALNSDEAYQKVYDFLKAEGWYFSEDREMESVRLIAEDCKYPDCKTILFL
jgi:hypothetical protein